MLQSRVSIPFLRRSLAAAQQTLVRQAAVRASSSSSALAEGHALDSLAVLRRLEASGLSTASSEALTTSLLDAIKAASQADAARYADATVIRSQTERLSAEIAALRAELKAVKERGTADLRYEVDKLNASQRLDLNLEKGRIREDLQKQSDRLMTADARIDKEVNQVRTQIEANKNDTMKWGIGAVVSVVGISLTALRMAPPTAAPRPAAT